MYCIVGLTGSVNSYDSKGNHEKHYMKKLPFPPPNHSLNSGGGRGPTPPVRAYPAMHGKGNDNFPGQIYDGYEGMVENLMIMVLLYKVVKTVNTF